MNIQAVRHFARKRLVGVFFALALIVGFLPLGEIALADANGRRMTHDQDPLFGIPDEPDPNKPGGSVLSPDLEFEDVRSSRFIYFPIILPNRVVFLKVSLNESFVTLTPQAGIRR
jgi:hypothetical protein